MKDTAMLLEPGNSLIAVSASSQSTASVEPRSPYPGLPSFRAFGVEQTGIPNGVEPVGANAIHHGAAGTSPPATGNSHRCILGDSKWQFLERGLRQRFEAVSACMDEIVSRRNVPAFLKQSSFLPSAITSALRPIEGTTRARVEWTWLASTDIHLAPTGEFAVLDHDFSLPTGLERLARNDDEAEIGGDLFSEWRSRNDEGSVPGIAILDPGFFSATFRGNEFLARCLNAHLVRSADLTMTSDGVFLKAGPKWIRISTVVRRIDDDLLDPNCFRPDSLVGLPGIVRAWKNGFVEVLSPPGSGFANSRSFGRLIPQMIRELMGEEPLLHSAQVLECGVDDVFQDVIANPERYAIRTNDPRHPARPFFGCSGTSAEFSGLVARLRTNPSAYVVRPLLPADQDPGINLRLFATSGKRFSLLRKAIGRGCQPDGGAPVSIGYDAATLTIV